MFQIVVYRYFIYLECLDQKTFWFHYAEAAYAFYHQMQAQGYQVDLPMECE